MLSYQHSYHAGNLADVHKHALLAWMLEYMTRKAKPLTYIETHAGRGLYDLSGPEARKTGEAAAGVDVAIRRNWLAKDHPYAEALAETRERYGSDCYPGSPLVARACLRFEDNMKLAELHPAEFAALENTMTDTGAECRKADGLEMALSWTPPDPRRGLLLCDPSYEVKADYRAVGEVISKVHRKWPVGVLAVWYPILMEARHDTLLKALKPVGAALETFEVRFPPARPGHGMVGSGMAVVNAPYGLDREAARLAKLFATL